MEINVQEPWFSALERSEKTVEGRLNKGKFATIRVGDVLSVSNKSGSSFCARVVRVTAYASFVEYLTQEGLSRTLPGIATIESGCAVYRQFYSEEDEIKYGVLAIEVVL